MSQLILIAGLKDGTVSNELTSYIKTIFPNHKDIWMDPWKKPRAVVLLDNKLDLKDIQKQFKAAEVDNYVDTTKTTQSVLVKTYKSMTFGVKDKLKYLFSSRIRGGSPVSKVKQLNVDDGCYEIFFLNWDAVLKACKQTWKVEEHTLIVTPYFECFREPVEQQLQRLIEQNTVTRQTALVDTNYVLQEKNVSSSTAVGKIHKAPFIQLPPQPSPGSNTHVEAANSSIKESQHMQPKHQGSTMSSHHLPSMISSSEFPHFNDGLEKEKAISVIKYNDPPHKMGDERCAKPILEHRLILMLLHLLHFEKAVQAQFGRITVIIDETKWEVEIKGPVSSLKIIQKLLTDEDELYQATVVDNFLTGEAVQQDLKAFITTEGLYVDIIDSNGKPCLQVQDQKGRKVPFCNFISSLVITKNCLPLPSEQSKENIKWINFMESFKSAYTHQQVFVNDQCVILVSLAHMSQDIDLILNYINNTIIQLKTDVPSVPQSGLSSAEFTVNSDEISQGSSASESSILSSSVPSKTISKSKKIIICPQHSAFLWILNVLNLREAVAQSTSNLMVDIIENEHEIIIKGPPKEVKKLKLSLMAENKQFPLSDNQEELLTNVDAQEHLKSFFAEYGCHIVLDDNLEITVAANNCGEKAQLRTFLTNTFEFRECSHLPQEYNQTSGEWNLLVEYVKHSQPHCSLQITDGKVYLLSVALGSESLNVDLDIQNVNEIISSLNTSVQSEEMVEVNSSEAPSHQSTSIDPKFGDEDMLHSLPTTSDDDMQGYKVTIICHNHVLLFILNNLHLEEPLTQFGVKVAIPNEEQIILKGPRDTVRRLYKIISAEDNKELFESHEEELLSDLQAQQYVAIALKNSEAQLILDSNFDFFVAVESGEKKQLREFITNFIQFRKCSCLPNVYQTTKEWQIYAEQFKSNNLYRILVTGDEVYLMTLAVGPHDADMVVKQVNNAISNCISSVVLDLEMTDYQIYDRFIDCPQMKKQYFIKFLKNESQIIESEYDSIYRSKIEIVEQGFQISSTSPTVTEKMQNEISQTLSQIKTFERTVCFPGLKTYLESMEPELMENLFNDSRCLIEISANQNLQSQRLSLSENISSEPTVIPEYKVVLLGTAKRNAFNIHFVQGDMKDLNLKMRIELQPSTAEEAEKCDIRTIRSSTNLAIALPSWSATNGRNENIRSSFQSAIVSTLQQAEFIGQTLIAISTEKLKDGPTGYTFPVDVIAKGIVETVEQFYSTEASLSKNAALDIYICEKRNEAVFKAFKFFLKLRGVYVGPPDHNSWNKVCSQESNNCPNYSEMKKAPVIEVVSSFPSHVGRKGCFFYPIQPSLEIGTCPAVKDYIFTEAALKSFLPGLQKDNPDGLLPSDIYSLKGFYNGRIAFIYCCPDWGMNAKKSIKRTLEKCIDMSSDCAEVYIVPPGMHVFPKYPEAFLAQALFKKLDKLMLHHGLDHKKKITFIVQEPNYHKAFNQELQKRLKKSNEKGWFGSLVSLFTESSNENVNEVKAQQPVTTRNQFPSTTIVFWCKSESDFQCASMQLEKHLKSLMKNNTTSLALSKEEMLRFQDLMKNMQVANVEFTHTEVYETKSDDHRQGAWKDNKSEKKKSQKRKLSGSFLKVQGLSKDCVDSFLDMAGLKRNLACKQEIKKGTKQTKTNKSTSSLENVNQHKQVTKFNKSDGAYDMPSDAPAESTPYKWFYEGNPGYSYQEMNTNDRTILEHSYSKEGKDSMNLEGKKFTQVNFIKMTVLEQEAEKGIIRMEDLDTQNFPVSFPHEWTSMTERNSKTLKLDLVNSSMAEFQTLQIELETCLKKHNLCIEKVSRVQSKKLYTRFYKKLSQMKNKDSVRLWHRPLTECTELVCKFGFHLRFSEMPEAKHLGDGVLFYKEPDKCFGLPIVPGMESYLFASTVLVGCSSPGKPKLRCPPSNEQTGEAYDSVHDNGAYMIFSDTQAYPDYLIKLMAK